MAATAESSSWKPLPGPPHCLICILLDITEPNAVDTAVVTAADTAGAEVANGCGPNVRGSPLEPPATMSWCWSEPANATAAPGAPGRSLSLPRVLLLTHLSPEVRSYGRYSAPAYASPRLAVDV